MAITETPADTVDTGWQAGWVGRIGVSCGSRGARCGRAPLAWLLNAGNGTLIDWPVAAPAARAGD